jgi:hypothetical protein
MFFIFKKSVAIKKQITIVILLVSALFSVVYSPNLLAKTRIVDMEINGMGDNTQIGGPYIKTEMMLI